MKTQHYDYMYTQAILADKLYSNNYVRKIFELIHTKINTSRIFKIPQEISNLFTHTTPLDTYVLPFETIFLEQSTMINDRLIINGILLNQVSESEKNLLSNPNEEVIWVFVNLEVNNKKISSTFLLSKTQGKREQIIGQNMPKMGDKHVKDVEKIVFNFLCFVNSPDIEYKTVIDSKRDTQIRQRKGKPQRPPIANIILTDPLKRYIYKQKHNEKTVTINHFFIVFLFVNIPL